MKTSNVYRSMAFRVVTLITALFTTQGLIAQGWFDNDWSYRRQVTVPNPGTIVLTDFQVKITLDNTFEFAKALADGSDLRITASDGTTLIPFWIEEWNVAGTAASIWVKVPVIATAGTNVYIYYGNPAPTEAPPGDPVETPPSGPFIKDSGNPIVPIGVPTTGASILLAENIVYDPVTQHYWMVLSNQTNAPSVCLVYSDDPANPAAWHWSGTVIPNAIAPHLILDNGTWYIFYGDRDHGGPPYPVAVASSPNVAGPYTYLQAVLPAGAAGTWEDFRADEPCVFQRNDGVWIMLYMGDSGGNVEQVGYATADNILGPYTKYSGNPCIPFGAPGSYDGGTVADPWIYEYHGVYYIGYTVSPSTSSPWQTALATTTDWQTFTKHGIILERGTEYNSFRGAVTRIGDEYVFSYTGGPSSGQYRMGIATQAVFQIPFTDITNNPDAVFDFYDGFDATSLDLEKWSFASGTSAQTTLSGGFLTLTGTSTYIRINGTTAIGTGYVGETRARHPNQGTLNLIMEVGFGSTWVDHLRLVDDFPSTTHWQRQTSAANIADTPIPVMNQTADQNWHVFRIYRESTGTAGFQIDNTPIETDNTNVPSVPLPPFLMSYGNTNQFIVDWTRVRKWAGSDPVITTGSEEGLATQWTGAVSNVWTDAGNWTAGVPAAWSRINIQGSAHVPVFAGTLNIDPAASLAIEPDGALTVSGDLNSNGLLTISSTLASSGSLIVTGNGTGSLTYSRQLQPGPDATRNWHLGAIPVTNNTESNDGKISAIYEWAEIPGSWNSIGITAALPGRGYNFRQTEASDGAISFNGSLVDEDIVVTASSPYADAVGPGDNYFTRSYVAGRGLDNFGGGGWNLLGNPYTSAIEAQGFIDENYDVIPAQSQFDPNYVALYLFDGTTRRYYYVAGSTGWPNGTELNETHVQAGQGFFVLAMNDYSEFRFTRAMQEHSTATAMLKSGGETDNRWPGLQLKIAHHAGEVTTTVVYDETMTEGVDPGYDIGLFKSGQDIEIYTTLALSDNGVNYTRQALPSGATETLCIPVGVDYKTGGEVTFSAITVPLGDRRFWLEDRATGIFTDLSLKSYTATLPANSYGPGRFYLLASANTPTGSEQLPNELTDLRIWVSNDRLIIKGGVSEGALCEIYDINGRILLKTVLTDGDLNTIDLPEGIHGVVVVRISDLPVIISRKVAIP